MQIVVELPEIIAVDIAEGFPKAYTDVIVDAIRKGIVLPEHGRLIDADVLTQEVKRDARRPFPMPTDFLIRQSPTLLEASEK